MTRWILLISFIILLGRLLYTTVSAWHHHQNKRIDPAEQTIKPTPPPERPYTLNA
ncbi:YfgG family protein [Sodalis-like endosymbiont of Proechinophthirus fluctus]|uniref:YfgG family protein n=1 Tax=Sodalis-like endosymbiont of Proechinophthirus fluctus TaxID=1462730 RepID=UPI00093A2C1A|nr:YfgG family protein [Sodalis-like endosymbiont of Proechinophthirus fluctus]